MAQLGCREYGLPLKDTKTNVFHLKELFFCIQISSSVICCHVVYLFHQSKQKAVLWNMRTAVTASAP